MKSESKRAQELADMVLVMQQDAVSYGEAVKDSSHWHQRQCFGSLVSSSFKYFNEIQKIRRAGREGRK